MAHFALALDNDTPFFKRMEGNLVDFLPGFTVRPFSWLGEGLSLTA
ncbi:hypothetical protein [Roseibacillus ishigakijimensis]|uniref:Uncharacterized protein n=1 Tax=Roseibacillus ishigakijimensis TaxID=454146 RepID=A0A934RS23_9BACT|nr:hypothetical protein [Roseibacillus ishigakijimensis]MBK1834611.1 hypothetical protein [Roseibacillus ishigakijimensis]